MQYREINDDKMIVGGQLGKVDNSSTPGESEHKDNTDTINTMAHSKNLVMRNYRPFKLSTAVIVVTAYILAALSLPGKLESLFIASYNPNIIFLSVYM